MLTQVGDRIGEAHALYCRGELYRLERNTAEAQNHFERALTLYRRTGDYTGEGLVRLVMSDGYRKMQRPNEAREMALEAAQRFKLAGRRVGASALIAGRGDVRRCRVRFDWGRANGNTARNLFVETGDKDSESRLMIGLGEMERIVGNVDEARNLFDRVLAQ